MKQKNAQSLAEYVIIASLIAIVLASMGPLFRRSIQRVVKSVADNIGYQSESEQASKPSDGFLNEQKSQVYTTMTSIVKESQGQYTATETEHTRMESLIYANGAFIERQ